MPLSIGYAQTDITPALDRPVFLAGFGRDRRATAIHDALYARALALRADRTTLVLVALDLIGFFRPYALEVGARIKEAVKDSGEVSIIVAATHTHHGPDTMGLWGPDDKTCGVDWAYLAEVKDKIVTVALAALKTMKPATMKTNSVKNAGFVSNFRNPEIVDDELTCAQFCDPQTGAPLATLFNFPCHPEVLWDRNTIITSDYPHYLRAEVEAQTSAPCLFFSGALGGMLSPAFPEAEHTFASAEQMGRALAQKGLAALAEARAQPVEIHTAKKEFAVKMTNVLFLLGYWRKLLPDTRNRRGEILTEANLIKFGPLWFATVPGEMLPKLGLALKADLTRAGAGVAGIVGLANDELGYILPREDFKYPLNPFNPKAHYEETVSIGKDMGPATMAAVRSLL